ncbi:hypothetical protein L7F22_036659 [Adiantum nelumboides]|nr:hypothetical protein [Adiantum nelumboides]MCO5582760.1 hypothetical protein [Adiantum nelumboides]
MGRRSTMSMKMVLPTVSWVAVMRLLKKAPSGVLALDAASKALLSCGALPDTSSFRYVDTQIGGRPGVRRSKAAAPGAVALLGCASMPHTDSFRIHHVVNHEALQLVLSQRYDEGVGQSADEIFYEADEADEPLNCSFDMIIRDGDRLLHDVEAASASVMSVCSNRLSNCTAGSSRTAYSAAPTAFSSSSVDSEESHYSTASSASFQVTPERHIRRGQIYSCSSPESYCHSGINLPAGIDDSADTDCRSEVSAESCDDSLQELQEGRSIAQAGDSNVGQRYADVPWAQEEDARHARDGANDMDDDEDGMHGHDDDDELNGDDMVTETCYSDDPLLDFEESIEELVRCHELIGDPDQLHALYCRYIQLNPSTLHPTIAMAFFHTLERLNASHN